MMLVDALIHWVIAWYVEAVFPGQYGVPRPWYFCFTRSYWCGKNYNKDDLSQSRRAFEMEQSQEESDRFEGEPSHLPLGVSIRGMKKVYKKGHKTAVDGLKLNFY